MNHLAAIRSVSQITASTWLKSRIRNTPAAPRRAPTSITIIRGMLIDSSFYQWQHLSPLVLLEPVRDTNQSAPQAITVISIINIAFIINVIITTTSWVSTHLLRRDAPQSPSQLIIKMLVIDDANLTGRGRCSPTMVSFSRDSRSAMEIKSHCNMGTSLLSSQGLMVVSPFRVIS